MTSDHEPDSEHLINNMRMVVADTFPLHRPDMLLGAVWVAHQMAKFHQTMFLDMQNGGMVDQETGTIQQEAQLEMVAMVGSLAIGLTDHLLTIASQRGVTPDQIENLTSRLIPHDEGESDAT